ncbi:MAG TPA: class I tRNA ligase family protein, partial [Erysipelothrix sp.]|nr:class I tRNA ligase family protein [Erysipelothrix sp.]
KMSKSLGNGIDPMDLIEDYGVDALRFFLVTSATMGQDMRFSQEKLEAAWSFINKIYNSSRFVLMYLEDDFKLQPLEEVPLSVIDRWILDRFNYYSQHIAQLMDQYDFVAVGTELIAFIWDDFCSWYIELAKSQLQSSDEQIKYATQWTLVTVLSGIVKMIHPFMPFVSEEIYLALPSPLESINLESWPTPLSIDDQGLEQVAHLIEMIEALRKVRVDFNIKAATELSVRILDTDDQPLLFSEELKAMLYKMVKTHPIQEVKGQLHEIGLSFGRIALEMGSLIDKETQLAQLHKEQAHLQAEIKRAENMLANENFVKKAPASKVEAEQTKLVAYQHQLTVVEKQLAELE